MTFYSHRKTTGSGEIWIEKLFIQKLQNIPNLARSIDKAVKSLIIGQFKVEQIAMHKKLDKKKATTEKIR